MSPLCVALSTTPTRFCHSCNSPPPQTLTPLNPSQPLSTHDPFQPTSFNSRLPRCSLSNPFQSPPLATLNRPKPHLFPKFSHILHVHLGKGHGSLDSEVGRWNTLSSAHSDLLWPPSAGQTSVKSIKKISLSPTLPEMANQKRHNGLSQLTHFLLYRQFTQRSDPPFLPNTLTPLPSPSSHS